eukprot:TRINITY_DN5646_c0_g2_i1.p1 TRINITY_DN5646_c0_g2~~TRINITY_DN5646_c0_g2_i1.p1  ORF type:complete len:103 (-),score=0.25 TRINITY_DN5646_c0_g2_i1:156-464(-)
MELATTMRNRRRADDGKCTILVRRCRADDSKWGTRMRQCHDRVFTSAVATDRRDFVVYVAPSSKVCKATSPARSDIHRLNAFMKTSEWVHACMKECHCIHLH